MKYFPLLIFFIFGSFGWSQSNTEVYTMDILLEEEGLKVTKFLNVSRAPGYDNQPSFFDNDQLLFAGTRKEDTDIALSSAHRYMPLFLFQDTEGGEYSPQRIPNSKEVAAVRLDADGLQRLYAYPEKSEDAIRLLHPNLQVAYYAFANKNSILASVLAGDKLDLVLADLQTGKVDTIVEGSGRSIHKVPNSNAMSYTLVNEDGNLDVYQFDIATKESFFVCQLPLGIQDHIWIDDTKLLIGSRKQLFLYDLFGNGDWKKVADLSNYPIDNITRMAISENGKKLAIVAEPVGLNISEIVDKQLEFYNGRQLLPFVNSFTEDVQLYQFPNKLIAEGREAMKAMYEPFFRNTPDLKCVINNRIVYENTVIDEEHITMNGNQLKAIAIYEFEGDKISKVTFIQK